MNNQTIEFIYEKVDPTLAFQLFNEISKKDGEALPSSLKEFFKNNLTKLGHLSCTNLYVFHKINSLIDFINTIKDGPGRIQVLEPNVINDCGNVSKVASIVDSIIQKFDDKKMTEKHRSECITHKLLYSFFWHSFIRSLYGKDFGRALLSTVSASVELTALDTLKEINDFVEKLISQIMQD